MCQLLRLADNKLERQEDLVLQLTDTDAQLRRLAAKLEATQRSLDSGDSAADDHDQEQRCQSTRVQLEALGHAREMRQLRDYVDQLPFTDSVGIFGLHANAKITFEKQESDKLLATVTDIQPALGGGGSGGSA